MRVVSVVAGLSLVASTAAAQTFGGHPMQLNGSGGNGTPQVSGGILQLINDQYGSATSAFTTDLFGFTPTTPWSTGFTLLYTYTSDVNGFGIGGDGIAFVMQSGPATAVGNGGGDLGFNGISNSVGVMWRSFWNDVWIGSGGTAFQQQISTGGLTIDPTNVPFLSIGVNLGYDGAGNLAVGFSTSQGQTFNGTFLFDTSPLGSSVRLGFTGGSGAATQLAEVENWTVTGLTPETVTPEPATLTLVASGMVAMAFAARRPRRAA